MKSERNGFWKISVFAILFAVLAFISIGCASADTIYVPEGGNQTIQQAVDNAANDEITNVLISQSDVDSDGDGVSDYNETNGFTWNNVTYYTDPLQKSTDFDPYGDYKEITTINMDPTVLSPGRHPLVPSYPDLKVDIGKIMVTTLTEIRSTETKENNTTWDINTLTEDVTKESWGNNAEAEVGWSWTEGVYACVKAYAYHDYLHLLTTISTGTTSGWSKEAWSIATAVDTDKAAKLKFYLRIRNNGTDTAKNIKLKFNVKIGDNIITTITTEEVSNRIDPKTVFPQDTFFVIDKDSFGKDITVTLDQLRSIELGVPITIKIIEIYAEVPWENEQYKDWSDYKASIDKTSAKIVLDTGGGVEEYRIFSGIRYPATGSPYYFMNVTLENATLYTLGGEQRGDGIYIGGVKVEDWRFGFDNSTFSEVLEHLNKTNGSLLSIPIRQGWTVVMKPPDTMPPEIHWATYRRDMEGIEASVSDNENIENVRAYVKVGSSYRTVELTDEDRDMVYRVTLNEKITDIYNGYVTANDGKFSAKLRILSIPDIIVDDDLKDDPASHTWNTIQEGIDAANESDVIYVRNGTYKENIAIYKPLTLIGEDNNNTIIDGGNNGDAVYVNANNVQISGFKIINGKAETDTSKIRGEVASGSFEWTPDNFGGFWYDLDEDMGNETLTAVVSGRSIYTGNLVYRTTPQEVSFEYSPFGKYQATGFMGEKYFAGYTTNTTMSGVEEEDLLSRGYLSEVLIDEDDKHTITIGSTLPLKEGYALKAIDISVEDTLVRFVLLKDGEEVSESDEIVDKDENYVYEKKIGNVSDVPIIIVHVETVFHGRETDAAFIRGVFQISENPAKIETGDTYGIMEVTTLSGSNITMKNTEKIYLALDDTIYVMREICFRVADSDELRFYPFMDCFWYREIHEIRGMLASGAEAQTWDPYSFAGFYYDLDQDIKTEKLEISGISGRTIEKGNLTYQTYSTPKYFDVYKYRGILVNGEANYSVMGWKGKQYVAINGKTNNTIRTVLEQGSTDKKTLTIGETWDIGDGWTLMAQSIDAKATPRQAWLVLSKDGVKLEDEVVENGNVFIYKKDIGGKSDAPLFVTYIDSIFAGATSDMMQLKYTWAISPDATIIKEGDEFGKLRVVNATQEKLILSNNYNFSLDRGSTKHIIGKINFKIADSSELRYYPVKTMTVSWEASALKLDRSKNNIISNVNISNNYIGLYLSSSDNNILTGNTASSNNYCGIHLSGSSNNTLTGNTASSNNYCGIHLSGSSNNIMENNTASNDDYGIHLSGSSNNTLTGNTILENKYNFGVSGSSLSHFIQSIATSNIVDGKPIYYWVNQQDKQIPYDAGFVGVVNSTNITVKDITLTKNYDGVLFAYTDKSRIINISASSNSDGIRLFFSSNNTLTSNIASNNSDGIRLFSSGNNTIASNNASNNNYGISLRSSSNNTLINNNCSNNSDGIHLFWHSSNNMLTNNNCSNNSDGIHLFWHSSNNTLYHNNLINNTNHNAYDTSINQWNTSTVGNYYSDYTGSDNNSDGIGDTSYQIQGGSSIDYFPLMHLWEKPPLKGDLDGDNQITSTDAAIALNFAVRGKYDTAADVSGDGRVSSLDALIILQMAAGGKR